MNDRIGRMRKQIEDRLTALRGELMYLQFPYKFPDDIAMFVEKTQILAYRTRKLAEAAEVAADYLAKLEIEQPADKEPQ